MVPGEDKVGFPKSWVGFEPFQEIAQIVIGKGKAVGVALPFGVWGGIEETERWRDLVEGRVVGYGGEHGKDGLLVGLAGLG